MELDLSYLCTVIGNLSGIPVRIYENGKQIFYYSVVYLPKDPMLADIDKILSVRDSIAHYATDHFHYYGIVNHENTQIIVGPSRQIRDSDQDLKTLGFKIDVAPDDMDDFITGMKCIIQMPVESLMQMLCSINYVLNGEKKTLKDLAITEEAQEEDQAGTEKKKAEYLFSDTPHQEDMSLHNTYDLEQTMLNMVQKGDFAALSAWFSNAPAIRAGVVAADQLRQRKNIFIITATLVSRAAIKGGMSIDDAFTLSDAYIQKCEYLNTPDRLTNLQYHMILDFTDRVQRLKKAGSDSPLVIEVSNYIQHHISESITTEAMAADLHMSRTYLARRFKQETGDTLTNTILKEKTEEAKRLLRYTDKSLSAIALYLGFSSQSHFSRVFRKYTQQSPSEYRLKHAWRGR